VVSGSLLHIVVHQVSIEITGPITGHHHQAWTPVGLVPNAGKQARIHSCRSVDFRSFLFS
jgi:hypothetical protein